MAAYAMSIQILKHMQFFTTGDSSLLAEKTVEYTERNIQYARANLQVDGLQFSAQSLLNFHNEWLFLTNFLATDLDKGTPIITLVDDASSWQPGMYVVDNNCVKSAQWINWMSVRFVTGRLWVRSSSDS